MSKIKKLKKVVNYELDDKEIFYENGFIVWLSIMSFTFIFTLILKDYLFFIIAFLVMIFITFLMFLINIKREVYYEEYKK